MTREQNVCGTVPCASTPEIHKRAESKKQIKYQGKTGTLNSYCLFILQSMLILKGVFYIKLIASSFFPTYQSN